MIPYEQYMNPSQNTTVIGTGAYKFVEHVTRQYLTMEKNPDWWAAKAGLTKLDSFWYGTQYLDRIVTKWGAEDSVNLVALETGDTDVARLTYESTAQQAVLNPNLDVVFGGASRMMVVMTNVRNAPFTDVRAREMIMKAIDWTGVLAIAAQGLKPSISMFQDSPYEHADVAQHVANYDAARAQALYTQLNSEGLLNRKIILANSVGEPSDKAAEFILTSIKTLLPNLNITVKNVDTATMQTFRKDNIVYNPASPENHWDFCCNQGLPSGQESALTPVKNSFSKVSTYTSGPNATAGCPTCTTGNFAGYSDPQVETWITQASNDPVLANRVALLGQVENKVYDDCVYRPYCFAGQWYGLSKKVHGFQTSDVFKKGGFNWLDVWKEQ